MPEFKERVIDNVSYNIELMPVSVGLPLLEKLQSIILPIFASRTEYELGHTDTWISEAVASYLVSYSGIDLVDVSKKLLFNTEISYDVLGSNKVGSGVLKFTSERDNEYAFDNFFRGKYKTLFKVLAFSIEANYPDFFSEAFSHLRAMQEAFVQEKAILAQTDMEESAE